MYTIIFRLLNDLCEAFLEINKSKKMPGKEKEKRALQRKLVKDAKKC